MFGLFSLHNEDKSFNLYQIALLRCCFFPHHTREVRWLKSKFERVSCKSWVYHHKRMFLFFEKCYEWTHETREPQESKRGYEIDIFSSCLFSRIKLTVYNQFRFRQKVLKHHVNGYLNFSSCHFKKNCFE